MTVTVTGAGGQIGYALLFRIASGAMLGSGTPIRLRLLEIPAGLKSAEGTALELQDCAFGALDSVELTDNAGRWPSREPTSPCWSVRGRAARAWNAGTCSRPTAPSSAPRARPSTPVPPTT